MLLDNQSIYANAQAVTAVGDTPSTNSYDHGPGNSGVGAGGLWLIAKTIAPVTSGGAATLQAVLQDSADNTTFADVQTLNTPAAVASLNATKTFAVTRLPASLRRYSRIVWRVGTAAFTAGSFSAFVVFDADLQQYLPSGFKVGS